MSRPLVTVALFACEQAPFIDEAVAGALAQRYEPIEFLFCDDASTDGTADRIRAAAEGDHSDRSIRTHLATKREGLATRINEAVREARGELLVLMAGDDLSAPDRVERLMVRWQETGADALYSNATIIDEHGRAFGALAEASHRPPGHWRDVVEGRRAMLGCAEAVSARLFQRFGPLPADVIAEDQVLSLRAMLLSSIAYVDAPLVAYRRHGGNVSPWREQLGRLAWPDYVAALRRVTTMSLGTVRAWADDLARAREMGLATDATDDDLQRLVRRAEAVAWEQSVLSAEGSFASRFASAGRHRASMAPEAWQRTALIAASPTLARVVRQWRGRAR
jgi:glycosyltransferase involved in cell wall biosynthesis